MTGVLAQSVILWIQQRAGFLSTDSHGLQTKLRPLALNLAGIPCSYRGISWRLDLASFIFTPFGFLWLGPKVELTVALMHFMNGLLVCCRFDQRWEYLS